MTLRLRLLALVAIVASMGASHRTPNFVVTAATPEIAERVGQWAEHYRKDKALQWLGHEMPPWPQPCPLTVKVSMDGPRGATTFGFDHGRIMSQEMEIQGPLDRLVASVLPHEITHTVFAHYFRCPLPRWADEGGSVLSEDDLERERHDKIVRDILNQGRQIRLRTLLALYKYPQDMADVMSLYAEGYSMSDYLVKLTSRQTFLQFVAAGMRQDWDSAVRSYYHFNSVEELEGAWLKHLRDTRGQPHIMLAQNAKQPERDGAPRTVVRLTVPTSQQVQDQPAAPVYRGQAPEPDNQSQRFADAFPPPVQLGAPQPVTWSPAQIQGQAQPVPPVTYPVGFPR